MTGAGRAPPLFEAECPTCRTVHSFVRPVTDVMRVRLGCVRCAKMFDAELPAPAEESRPAEPCPSAPAAVQAVVQASPSQHESAAEAPVRPLHAHAATTLPARANAHAAAPTARGHELPGWAAAQADGMPPWTEEDTRLFVAMSNLGPSGTGWRAIATQVGAQSEWQALDRWQAHPRPTLWGSELAAVGAAGHALDAQTLTHISSTLAHLSASLHDGVAALSAGGLPSRALTQLLAPPFSGPFCGPSSGPFPGPFSGPTPGSVAAQRWPPAGAAPGAPAPGAPAPHGSHAARHAGAEGLGESELAWEQRVIGPGGSALPAQLPWQPGWRRPIARVRAARPFLRERDGAAGRALWVQAWELPDILVELGPGAPPVGELRVRAVTAHTADGGGGPVRLLDAPVRGCAAVALPLVDGARAHVFSALSLGQTSAPGAGFAQHLLVEAVPRPGSGAGACACACAGAACAGAACAGAAALFEAWVSEGVHVLDTLAARGVHAGGGAAETQQAGSRASVPRSVAQHARAPSAQRPSEPTRALAAAPAAAAHDSVPAARPAQDAAGSDGARRSAPPAAPPAAGGAPHAAPDSIQPPTADAIEPLAPVEAYELRRPRRSHQPLLESCPICGESFPRQRIQQHADACLRANFAEGKGARGGAAQAEGGRRGREERAGARREHARASAPPDLGVLEVVEAVSASDGSEDEMEVEGFRIRSRELEPSMVALWAAVRGEDAVAGVRRPRSGPAKAADRDAAVSVTLRMRAPDGHGLTQPHNRRRTR